MGKKEWPRPEINFTWGKALKDFKFFSQTCSLSRLLILTARATNSSKDAGSSIEASSFLS